MSSPAAFKAHVLQTLDKDWLYSQACPTPTAGRSIDVKGAKIEMRMVIVKK